MEGVGRKPDPMSFTGNINENYNKFIQRFNIYLQATEMDMKPDKTKIALLLNLMGPEGIEIFNTFKLSTEEQAKYDTVVKEFKNYCTPRKNKTYERFVFNSRVQKPMEPFDHFLSDLKKLIISCEYGDQEESILTDRIVLGINDSALQEKLLNVENLSLDKATKLCRNVEITKQQAKLVREGENTKGISVEAIQTKQKKQKEEAVTKRRNQEQEVKEFNCGKCGYRHAPQKCPAFSKKCKKCGKLNHFYKMCRVKNVKDVVQKGESESSEESELFIESVTKISEVQQGKHQAWTEVIEINNTKVLFKLDSGAEVNIIPIKIIEKLKKNENTWPEIKKTQTLLEAYGGTKIKTEGTIQINCKVKGRTVKLEFVIVNQDVKPILGIQACSRLGLIKRVEAVNNVCELIKENSDIFEGLGKFTEECKIEIKEGSIPKAKPARRIPLAVRGKVEKKLNELLKLGIISKVDKAADWVSNLVVLEKSNGGIRLCLDPSELNKVIKRQFFEIPSIDEISSKLAGKKFFTVLDFKDGFYQIKLDEPSSKLCTFSTPFGCFKFNRLPFGLNLAPELFQKLNEKNFGDIPNVVVYFDDLLIGASSLEEHDETLQKVINRARHLNVKFNPNKIQYRVTEVKYLGYIFDQQGRKIDDNKIKTISELKAPTNKKQLQKLMGVINQLRSFIPNLAEMACPLYELLKQNVIYEWTEVHNKTLEKIKNEISKAKVLMNFDPHKDVVIHTDASDTGLGCVLLQEARPVAYASRRLSETERRYAIIEKEMLGIVFAMQKFHNYVYGRRVTVITDHKPNVAIFNKQLSDIHSPRLQRMRLKLLKYQLNVEYLPGKFLYIADYLSRNCNSNTDKVEHEIEGINDFVHSITKYLRISKEKRQQFKTEILADETLQKVIKYMHDGWPNNLKNDLKIYYNIKNDLYIVDDLLFYNDRIVVPTKLRPMMLKLIHEGHFGVNRTRDRAKELLYWPGMSKDIGDLVGTCNICERYRRINEKEPLILHDIPDIPFQKLASDILDYDNKTYMVICDYLTKWIDIIQLPTKQSADIIKQFKIFFSNFGVPDIVIADNMPYSSFECLNFAKEWGFEFNTSSPRYPKSNGQAESIVKVAKNILKKSDDLSVALMEYRNTPITGLKRSPVQLVFDRKLKTKLPLVITKQDISKNLKFKKELENKRSKYKTYYDRHVKFKEGYVEGEKVVYRKDKEWYPATIIQKANNYPRSYIIRTDEGTILRRNSFHLRKSHSTVNNNSNSSNNNINFDWDLEDEVETTVDIEDDNNVAPNVVPSTRPKRNVRVPTRFKDYVVG